MIPRNCLSHALDRWHAEGGYLVLRKSSARAWQHVVTDAHDHAALGVWKPWKLVLAAWMFALGVTLWRVKRMMRRG